MVMAVLVVRLYIVLVIDLSPWDKCAEPDSRNFYKIAFTSTRDGNREIYVMNNDGTGQAPADQQPWR